MPNASANSGGSFFAGKIRKIWDYFNVLPDALKSAIFAPQKLLLALCETLCDMKC